MKNYISRFATARRSAAAAGHQRDDSLPLFVRNLPACVAMFDRDMRYLSASRRWMEEFSLGDGDLTGRSHYEIFPEIGERWKAVHRRSLAGEALRAEEDRFERADGSVQWLRWEVVPWFERTGAVGGIVIYSEDITARKQAELKLSATQSILGAALASMSEAIIIRDSEGRPVEVNEAFVRFFGFDDRSECLAALEAVPSVVRAFRLDGAEEPRGHWPADRALLGESAAGAEYRLVRTDTGRIWYADFSYAPIRASDGSVVGAVATARDVTHQKRNEKALLDQDRLLNQMGTLARAAGWIWDLTTDEVRATDELTEILERPNTGRPELDSFMASCLETHRTALALALREAVDHGTPYDLQLEIETPAGHRKWLHIIGVPELKDGRVLRIHGSTQDITERKRAENELQASERRLRLAQAAALAGTWEWEILTNRNYWSNEAFRLYGLEPGTCEPSYEAWLACVAPDDQAAAAAAVQTAAAQGTPIEVEWRVNEPSRPQRWLMSRGQPQFDDRGRLVSYLGIVLDITERKLAEQSLKASERRFGDIVAASADWVWEIDAEDRYTYASEGVFKALGYTPEEIVGRTPFDLMPEGERTRVKAVFDGIACRREPFRDLDNVNVRKDGRRVHVQTNGMPILDGDGKLLGYRGLDRDVTSARLAEIALQDSAARYRDMFEAHPHPMYVFEMGTGRFIAVNDSALKEYGYTREEFLAMTVMDIRPADDVPRIRSLVAGADPGTVSYGPWRHRRKDGTELLVEISAHAMDFGGRRAAVVLALNVTERVRAEQAIRALNVTLERRVAERTAELEQANLAKSDFLANMSHELRSPLNAILGFSEMLRDGVLGELDEKKRGFVSDIFDAGSHLLAVINDILDLSKVEAGKIELDREEVAVSDLLDSSVLVVREKALSHGIGLEVRADPELGTARLDRRKVKQIIFNLLSNAVKFTPDGGKVTLAARRCGRDQVRTQPGETGRILGLKEDCTAQKFVEISVQDTGPGITPEQLPRLFEPFVQVGGTETHPSGTGLGLSLARRLAELHCGTIAVASQPGQGCRFTVWLPIDPWDPSVPGIEAPRGSD